MTETTQLYDKYELDKDIPQSIWNEYLKKYAEKYQTFRTGEGTISIRTKSGHIQPYSLKLGYLLHYGQFHTRSKKTYFKKRFGNNIEIIQDCDTEVVIKFKEKDLENLAEALEIRNKRKKMSEEVIKANIERIKQYRYVKQTEK
jgi:hypothetical protein